MQVAQFPGHWSLPFLNPVGKSPAAHLGDIDNDSGCVKFTGRASMGGILPARAAITKYHRPGGLNNRKFFSHDSGSWKSAKKVLAGLVSLKPLSLDCRRPPSPSDFTWSPLVCVRVCAPICLSCRDTSHAASGSIQ